MRLLIDAAVSSDAPDVRAWTRRGWKEDAWRTVGVMGWAWVFSSPEEHRRLEELARATAHAGR